MKYIVGTPLRSKLLSAVCEKSPARAQASCPRLLKLHTRKRRHNIVFRTGRCYGLGMNVISHNRGKGGKRRCTGVSGAQDVMIEGGVHRRGRRIGGDGKSASKAHGQRPPFVLAKPGNLKGVQPTVEGGRKKSCQMEEYLCVCPQSKR